MAGGMYGGGQAWWGDMHGRGACVVGKMATAANGMHPTGMHSCIHHANIPTCLVKLST